MFSMYDPIGLTNGSNLGLTNGSNLGLITTGESEDDDDDDDALMKTIITLKNQIDELPKVHHQYQILKLIYVHFLSNIQYAYLNFSLLWIIYVRTINFTLIDI
jgi:hypothetical protein